MKTIVLFILAALVAAVFAQLPAGVKEGQKYVVTPELVRDAEPVGKPFKAEECAEIREVTCQYLKKCSKIAKENECLKWETFDVCVQEKVEQYKETKEICVQLETFDKFQPDKCYKCAKKGTEQVTKSRTVCAKYEKQTKCTQRGPRPMCEEYQLVKHCYELTPAYIVEGPKTCPTNQEVFFTLQFQGANEKHKIVRQCRPKTNFSKTQCQGTLDPHMRSNKGQNFEFQHTGDFKFIITSDGAFECHVRLQHMIPGTKWTGPSAFACRVNGVDIFYWDQGSFRVNGHPVTVTASSQYNFPEGGHIKLENSGKRVRIVSPNRAELFFDLAATYQNGNEKIESANFYGLIPSDLGVTGLCAGGDSKQIDHWLKDRAYGLFPFTYEAKILGSAFPEPTFTATERKNAEALCTPIFDPKARKIEFENCVDDILHTNFVNLDATLQAEKDAALNTPNK